MKKLNSQKNTPKREEGILGLPSERPLPSQSKSSPSCIPNFFQTTAFANMLFLVSIFTASMLACCSGADGTRSWEVEALPHPINDVNGTCGVPTRSCVCDPGGVLSDLNLELIQESCEYDSSAEATSTVQRSLSAKKARILRAVVVVLPVLPVSARDGYYARDLQERWNFKFPISRNDITIVVATRERIISAYIDPKTVSFILDSSVRKITSEAEARIDTDNIGMTIGFALSELRELLWDTQAMLERYPAWCIPILQVVDIKGVLDFLMCSFFVYCIAWTYCLISGPEATEAEKYSRCNEILEGMDVDRRKASAGEYVASSCPDCLESFDPSSRRPAARSRPVRFMTYLYSLSPSFDHRQGREEVAGRSRARNTANREIETTYGSTDSSTRSTPVEFPHEAATKRLPCGHRFHANCVDETFLQSISSLTLRHCSVCLQPRDGSNVNRLHDYSKSGQPFGWKEYNIEFGFRLRCLQRQYPRFITGDMVAAWVRQRCDLSKLMASSAEFRRRRPD